MSINRRFLLKASTSVITASMLGKIGFATAAERMWMYDSHCHLISEDEERFPHANNNPPAGGGGGQPPGQGPGAGGPPPPGVRFGQIHPQPTVSNVLKWMEENDVKAAAAVQKKGTYGFDNSYVLAAADTVSDKFTAVTVIDAEDSATPNLIREFSKKHEFAGIRMSGGQGDNVDYAWLLSDNALKTWAAANELGLSVDLMAVAPGYSAKTTAHYYDLARKFPKTRLVLNHIAWPDLGTENYGINAELKKLSQLGNVYFKFTTINLDMLDAAEVSSSEFLRIAIDALGANRIMWGSDIGNSAGTYGQMVARMLAAAESLTAEEKQWVLSDSARTAYSDF